MHEFKIQSAYNFYFIFWISLIIHDMLIFILYVQNNCITKISDDRSELLT